MIRRHEAPLRIVVAALDAITTLALAIAISQLRFGADWASTWSGIFAEPWMAALLLIASWLAVLWLAGLYRLGERRTLQTEIVGSAKALAIMALLTFALLFALKLPDVSRSYLFALLPSMAFASMAIRALVDGLVRLLRVRGKNTRNVVVVGSGQRASQFIRELEARSAFGLRVVGFVDGQGGAGDAADAPFLGPIRSLQNVIHDYVVDEIALCIDLSDWSNVREVIETSRAEGIVVRIPLAGALGSTATYVEDLAGIPVLSLHDRPDRQVGLAVKRFVDIVLSVLGLTLGSPIFVIAALAVLLNDGRPILFSQERVGLHGRRFRLLKFRTMICGAESQREALLARNERKGPTFKVTNDPRITRVGKFLRAASLDELPQLWNVLIGEMSLVGPRPPLPAEVDEYDAWHRRRLSMKPGITGLWQVEARREPDFDRWVERDLEYIDSWSLWLDAKIAARTLPAMVRFEGR